MRMIHYFGAMALLVVPLLLWTAWTGYRSMGETHVAWGLASAVFAAAAHVLLILFVLVTGRVLREAMRARPLGPQFLAELNEFFARKKAYPVALLSAASVAAAAVLGYAHRGFGTPSWVHGLAGLAAIAMNLWAIPLELRALRENRDLIDHAARELDRIDREGGAAAAEPVEWASDPRAAARFGLAVAAGAWFPYLYWALIVWRGDLSRVSLHPWIEISAFGLFVWLIARREGSE